jgi:WD40 repeat protein
VQSVGFSSDGRSIVIVTVLGGDVMVWDGTSLRPVSFTPSIDAATTAAFMPEGLPFMPTGTEIAVGTASGDLVLEDVDENLDGTPGATIPTGCTVGHIEISDDGMRLASSCVDSNKLVIVDGTTGSAEVEEGPAAVDTTVFSPDGNTLITGTSDGLVYRRDGSTGRSASVGVHRDRITAVAYSPDGRFFASASEDGSVIIYPATSTLISARLTTGFDSVAALAFTPDGSHLVAFGGTENSARIWRVFPDIGTALCDRTPYNLNEEDWNKWVSSSLDHELPCPGKPPQPGRGS